MTPVASLLSAADDAERAAQAKTLEVDGLKRKTVTMETEITTLNARAAEFRAAAAKLVAP